VAQRVLRVELNNSTGAVLPLQLVARLLTWEGAPIGDELRTATLPDNGRTTVEIPLPKGGATNYQALDFEDAFIIRLGVLSGDGRQVLHEARLPIDLRPALRLSLQTDEERSRTYPFNAPPPGKGFRMGTPLPAYAYQPGATVNARISLSNGLENLAPKAKVRDETTPDNASVMALSDGAMTSEKGPIDGIVAYGAWAGATGKDNVLQWEWPAPVTVAAVTLAGAGDNFRNLERFNSPVVIVEADGKEVAREEHAKPKFLESKGRLRLAFAPVVARTLRVKLPWSAKDAQGRDRVGVWLGEVEIEGTLTHKPKFAPARGILTLNLVDALNGKVQAVATRDIEVAPLTQQVVALPLALPGDDKAPRFWRLDARFSPQAGAALSESAPVLSVEPRNPLLPMTAFRPAEAAEVGFIVTRGFRNILDSAVGTNEIGAGWGQPDDLVWAYAHGFKQNGPRLRTEAKKLYVSENDMRHYSTPWRSFLNGEEFYWTMADQLVARMKEHRNWGKSNIVVLGHSDRWDTGPPVGSMNSWQDYEGFNEYLKAHGSPGLKARTLETIAEEISEKYPHEWQAWHLERYVRSVRTLREAFAREGKELVITAQGLPLVPPAYEAELARVIKGSSDDITWGMEVENVPLTTARQMALLAFNPSWQMSTLIQWGWDSAELGNAHWHAPVGTTEPSRRHLYDRAFRGLVRPDGRYTSMQAYGYNTNGGFAFTMTPNDFAEWHRVQERHSLLTPDAPWGVGLVLSNSRLNDPKQTAFDGAMGYNLPGLESIGWTQAALRRLHEGGLSVPFTANATSLKNWKGDAPLIAVNLWEWSADEIAALKMLSERGVPVAALGLPEGQKLPPAAAQLFGVTPEGDPMGGQVIDEVEGHKVIQNGNRIFVPIFAKDLTAEQGRLLAPLLRDKLGVPLQFPAGTAGYGFVSNGRRFIVLEDWREEGRIVPLRVRSNAANLRAINVNEHTALTTRRDGQDWIIDVPLRSGDGVLVAVEEGA
ncbi:MAG: hypothetical protein M3347_02190, partial [Armatimonadota bacterium]|nr:hypothetical protein [Armatimonadota bacterium]